MTAGSTAFVVFRNIDKTYDDEVFAKRIVKNALVQVSELASK